MFTLIAIVFLGILLIELFRPLYRKVEKLSHKIKSSIPRRAIMLELACKEAVFHFNKKHLEDPTIPMWVVKAKGKTYYVDHVRSIVPFSTKETPDNSHTKGAIKFKDVLVEIDDSNVALFKPLTSQDLSRIRAKENGYVRILISYKKKVMDFLQEHDIKFTPFKTIHGSCGTSYYICDIMNKNDIVMMQLGLGNSAFRVLQENETYYKAYDDPSLLATLDADDIDYDLDDEDDEDEDDYESVYEN